MNARNAGYLGVGGIKQTNKITKMQNKTNKKTGHTSV